MKQSQVNRRGLMAAGLLGGGWAAATTGFAQSPPSSGVQFEPAIIDALVARFMAAFEIPGMAVGILGAGPTPYLKGYGVRTLGKPDPVDVHTRFAIASNSKAFSAAALALLVDEHKLAWDDPVVRYLPTFRMRDPAVTRMMTIRDLLVHRSGLSLGAGDLLYFPDTTHSAADALKALPYLKSTQPFRGGYAYDNILYTVAGLVVERVSGMSWRRFVQSRLLAPIGMDDATPALALLRTDNVAGRHGRRSATAAGVGPMTVVEAIGEQQAMEPAGGLQASITDIMLWLRTQIAQGLAPNGRQIWSQAQAEQMWTPQTITLSAEGQSPAHPTGPVLQAYALGWFVQDYRGQRMIWHSGGLVGQVTQTAILPERGLAVAVFSNVEDGSSVSLRNAILDELLGAPKVDWLERRQKAFAQSAEMVAAAGLDKPPPGAPSLPLTGYVGRYRDPWYGDIVVGLEGSTLTIAFQPTPSFKSRLEPWGKDSFRTRFPATVGEDALVTFVVERGTVKRIAMKALSPLADFSYDFQDLDFRPVRPQPGRRQRPR
ncbi:serine hydrolase [Phenylobacterium sp.]|uniref:serine hydrolase n=1 Tax=Phenylobacterium sp. TaxID=1871053 RepID=UPI00374CF8C7